MKKLIVISILFLLTSSLFGQQATATSQNSVVPKEEQATREDVVALMEVMHSRRQVVAVIDMMKEQMLNGMHQSFLREHPKTSAEALKKLDATMEGVWKFINIDELVEVSIPVYQKYLSHEDAVALISFYSSPTGQRFLDRMPALVQEAGAAGAKVMQSHMDEIQAISKQRFQEFVKYAAAHPEELGETPKQEPAKSK